MSDEVRVGIVLVSHSAALAEGTAEVAGQIGGGSVVIAPAGGTDDGGIGTSIARVRRALREAGTRAGVVDARGVRPVRGRGAPRGGRTRARGAAPAAAEAAPAMIGTPAEATRAGGCPPRRPPAPA